MPMQHNKRFSAAVITLLFPFLLSAQKAAGIASENPEVTGAIRLFDAWMQGQLTHRAIPGVAIGIVHDQRLVWAKGYGLADVATTTPMTPATRFRMASHSKLFTATAIMQLREAGKVRLDDPINKYLPWFSIAPAEPGDPPITIEELLTHSSGLPREAGPHWVDYNFPDAQGVKQYLATHRAPYSPEVRWKYSNLALTLAGMIVESASGERFNDYVQLHILKPLGMKDSSIDQPDAGLATGYGLRKPDGSRITLPFVDSRAMSPATGLTSNIEDMSRFVSLQFRAGPTDGGAQILNTGSLREMHRVRRLENDWQRGNAIGFAVSRIKDKTWIGHGGSYPGYKTQTYLQLDAKVGVIVLTNADDAGPGPIALRAMETIADAISKAAPQKKSPAVPWDPAWSRFAGRYQNESGFTQVVEMDQRLVLIDPTAETLSAEQRLEPLGNGLFRLEAPTGGGAVGETVRFAESNGKITRMYTGDSYRDRKQ